MTHSGKSRRSSDLRSSPSCSTGNGFRLYCCGTSRSEVVAAGTARLGSRWSAPVSWCSHSDCGRCTDKLKPYFSFDVQLRTGTLREEPVSGGAGGVAHGARQTSGQTGAKAGAGAIVTPTTPRPRLLAFVARLVVRTLRTGYRTFFPSLRFLPISQVCSFTPVTHDWH